MLVVGECVGDIRIMGEEEARRRGFVDERELVMFVL